jgi:hypothetical protein
MGGGVVSFAMTHGRLWGRGGEQSPISVDTLGVWQQDKFLGLEYDLFLLLCPCNDMMDPLLAPSV